MMTDKGLVNLKKFLSLFEVMIIKSSIIPKVELVTNIHLLYGKHILIRYMRHSTKKKSI